jgi:4-amino-4-deoxy-L-arabinose transferase-like glycosyltransferase
VVPRPGLEDAGAADSPGPGPRLLILLAAAAAYALLRGLSFLDDNRLVSWAWHQAGVSPSAFAGLTLAALALAWLLWLLPPLPARLKAPALLLGLAAALAPLAATPEVILDAGRYFTYAKHAALHGLPGLWTAWGAELPVWSDLPATSLLHGLAFTLLGEQRLAVQVLHIALYALTAVLARGLGRRLWGEAVGGGAGLGDAAGLLMAAFPFALAQVPLMLADVPAMFFLTLALYALARTALDGDGVRAWVWAGGAALAGAAALLAKYSLWPLYALAPLALWAWADTRGQRLRVAGALAGAAGLAACFVLAKPEVVSGQLGLLGGYQWGGLGRWGESLVSTFFFQTHPFVTLGGLAGVAVLGLPARRRESEARRALPLLAVLVLALVLGGRRSRYLIPVLPLMALIAARGLAALRPPSLGVFAALAAAVCSLALALCFQLPFLESVSLVNLREAARHLDGLGLTRARVITLPAADDLYDPAVLPPLIDLYAATPLCYEEALSRAAPGRDVSRSSLRFTWEFKTPAWLGCPAQPSGREALVVIGDGSMPLESLGVRLRGLRLSKAFLAEEGVFALKTWVWVYAPEEEPAR